MDDVSKLDADGFSKRYGVNFTASLGYDPKVSVGLDRIQASSAALSAPELDRLAANGFVVSGGHTFPTFTYGYAAFYAEHLPLYVSADSILNAVHRSYDEILKQTEESVLIPELGTLLDRLRAKIAASSGVDAGVTADVDFYLAVARSLLQGSPAAPVGGASASEVAAFASDALAASGMKARTLFGVSRDIDFSQFTPRGHYTDSKTLERYFRAMMWLGRIDFRLIETQANGNQVFHRRQFDAMLALTSLFDADNVARHRAIDQTIEAFVGESDNMKVADVGRLLTDLGAPAGAAKVDLPDARVAQAILDGGYGAQRIASDIMVNALPKAGTLPLHRTFLVFGQRYTVDSHVFSNVVYDRLAALRMMPDPLDAAFAALGNDQAGILLDRELRKYSYAPSLASMRVLVDAHGDAFWGENLYNIWLSSLRALSPTSATADPAAAGMPRVTGTEPWGRRILSTQLASWAELRHDTILYVKQSYTSGAVCEFPDAYVEPYPAVFGALERFAAYGASRVVPVLDRAPGAGFKTNLSDYFTRLAGVAKTLREMAESERAGTPFSADQMAFINGAVTVQEICGGASADGWYPRLVFGDPTTFDPTIADVHTQPFDETGSPVGRVLHVGTGYARLLIVTADTCTGPHAYAGLASSYYEKTTQNFDRLTDERWKHAFGAGTPPADVAWMSDLIGR
jgi:hypothetical protein